MDPDTVPQDSPLRGGDPLVLEAAVKAQQTFRYLWRELSWESRRVVPALDLACVKAPFFDDHNPKGIEHMWISELDFNGVTISGKLINQPKDLKSVKEGDAVDVPLNGISDWMYALNNRVYGAYTVNMLRATMSTAQREEHDRAWGLDFGDPQEIILCPTKESKGEGLLTKALSKGQKPEDDDHPMSKTMGPKLIEFLDQNPEHIDARDEKGRTMLHRDSLAGNRIPVEILLDKGANHELKTHEGMTALDLANTLNWEHISMILSKAGAQ